MDQMANHATRIRRYMDRHGQDVVENFIDVCLSLENLIDRYSPYVEKSVVKNENQRAPQEANYLLRVDRSYMRDYINPPAFVQEQKRKAEEAAQHKAQRFPQEPEKDILNFLIHYAP